MPLKGGKRKTRRNYKRKTFRRKQKKRKTRRKSRKSKKKRTRRRRKRKMVGGELGEKLSLETRKKNIEEVKQAIESVKNIIVHAEYGSYTGEEKIQNLNQNFTDQMGKLDNAIKSYAPAFPVTFLSKRTAGLDRATVGSKPKIIKYYDYDEYPRSSRSCVSRTSRWVMRKPIFSAKPFCVSTTPRWVMTEPTPTNRCDGGSD